jgi:hypothetical protein
MDGLEVPECNILEWLDMRLVRYQNPCSHLLQHCGIKGGKKDGKFLHLVWMATV